MTEEQDQAIFYNKNKLSFQLFMGYMAQNIGYEEKIRERVKSMTSESKTNALKYINEQLSNFRLKGLPEGSIEQDKQVTEIANMHMAAFYFMDSLIDLALEESAAKSPDFIVPQI